MRSLTTNIIDNEVCRAQLVFFQRAYVLNETVCSHNEPWTGLSLGDHGTGLFIAGSDKLVGVASVFLFDPQNGAPDVFTRIHPYLDWIRDTVMKSVRND